MNPMIVTLRVLLLVAVASAMGVAGLARAQTPELVVDPEAVRQAARIALAQGVAWLKAQSTNDAEGWIAGPSRTSKLIGTTDVTNHYRQVITQIPVFEYSNYVTFVQTSPTEPPHKVVERRAVRQIGTKPLQTVVYDKDGPIGRIDARPIYQAGGNIFWRVSGLGDAALVVYALRQAGVPDEDPVVQRMLENLRGQLTEQGLPDETWNLAWLTVVFAATPGTEAADLTERLAGRLMDGQIVEGAARGLWGPLCINPRLLAPALRDYLALIADLQKKEQRVKLKDTKPAQAAVERAQAAVTKQQEAVRALARSGTQFAGAEYPWVTDPHADPVVKFAGASHFYFNQTVADLESTWVALFALSSAAGQQRLPAQTLRPKPVHASGGASATAPPAAPAAATAMPRPETSEAVLARAANTLAARQQKDGLWNECNLHQPVTEFDAFTGTLPVPADPKSFPPLNSATTAVSVVQGIAALDSVGRAVGMDRLMRGFQSPYVTGLYGREKEVDAWLSATRPKIGARQRLTMADFALYLALARPLSSGRPERDVPTGDTELMVRLILGGSPDGDWGRGVPMWFATSSTRARLAALKPLTARVWGNGEPVEMNKAHLWLYNIDPVSMVEWSPIVRDGQAYATAVAVLYLASRVPDPAAAVKEWSEKPALVEVRKGVEQVLVDRRVPKPVPAPVAAAPATNNAPVTAVPVTNSVPPAAVSTNRAATKETTEPIVPAELDVPVLPAAPAPPADTAPKSDEAL